MPGQRLLYLEGVNRVVWQSTITGARSYVHVNIYLGTNDPNEFLDGGHAK